MSRRLQVWIALSMLLLAFALAVLLSSGKLPTGTGKPTTNNWEAPPISTALPSPTPTPGWWSEIVTPTAVITPTVQP